MGFGWNNKMYAKQMDLQQNTNILFKIEKLKPESDNTFGLMKLHEQQKKNGCFENISFKNITYSIHPNYITSNAVKNKTKKRNKQQ